MSMTHEVYERGQIVIPKYIRDLLGWGKGTPVSFTVEGDKVVLQRAEKVGDDFLELAKKINLKKKDIDMFVSDHSEYGKRFSMPK
ncbi:MAG: AbrB/MazE/SpoVT family DNA-binding domain-containing protein [Candidatus Micrarchaeota archaeon]